jgi:lysophospholipase L1-like esterase
LSANARFSRGRSLAFSALLVTGVLAAAEGALRLVGLAEPARPRILLRSMDMDVSFPFMRADPELFWSLQPGFQGEFQRHPVTINALGLRGPELARPKPPGRRRIACFGDSITFGFGLGDQDSYPACLGRLLADRGVEVVNAGTTGYTSHQVLGLLRRLAPQLQADLATFCVGWNDGNQRAANDRGHGRRLAASMALEGTLRHVYLYRAIKSLYFRMEARQVRRGGQAATDVTRGGDPSGRGARVPLVEYRENLASIVAVCRAHGIRPLFVELPLRKRPGDPPADSPYPAALREAARQLGVPLLELPELGSGATVADNQADFIDPLHFSPSGSEKAARELARQLAGLGVI